MARSRMDGHVPSDSGGPCGQDAIPDQSGVGHPLVLEPIDPLVDPAWDEAVLRHPDATIFHSSAWARVLAETYGHRPAYFRCRRDGRTEALVPIMEVRSCLTGRRGVCLPFSDYCGPLVFPGMEEGDPGDGADQSSAHRFLHPHLAAMAAERGWKHLELRADSGAGEGGEASDATFVAHQLEVRGTREDLQAGFASSVRRALRKATQSGVTTRVCSSWEAMEIFHRLHLATRRRHGVPPQPLAFFRNIQREILAAGHGFVVIAEHGGRPIAAAVFLHFGERALYKFGASDQDAWELRPNNLVMAEGIFSLAARGTRTLHFGRTDPHQDGLRRFKRQWGAKESPLSYRKFEPISGQWLLIRQKTKKNAEWPHSVIRHLPGAASRALGSLMYPHLD